MIEKGIYARLAADSTLRGIVATSDSPQLIKVFAGRVEQEMSEPYVMFWRVGTNRPNSIAGHNGAVQALIQVDCFATTYGQLKSMMDAIRLSLDGFKGTMGTEDCKASRLVGEREYYDREAELFVGALDFHLWYVEALV